MSPTALTASAMTRQTPVAGTHTVRIDTQAMVRGPAGLRQRARPCSRVTYLVRAIALVVVAATACIRATSALELRHIRSTVRDLLQTEDIGRAYGGPVAFSGPTNSVGSPGTLAVDANYQSRNDLSETKEQTSDQRAGRAGAPECESRSCRSDQFWVGTAVVAGRALSRHVVHSRAGGDGIGIWIWERSSATLRRIFRSLCGDYQSLSAAFRMAGREPSDCRWPLPHCAGDDDSQCRRFASARSSEQRESHHGERDR